MITISLCMIVKNEAAVLARCLDSVKEAIDEIIIVDTGSTDATVEIAKQYTEHIYRFPWQNHFARARNYAFAQAHMEYQMWLDADDVFPPEELQKLLELKATLSPDVDMATMLYHTNFDESGAPICTAVRERLLKRERNYQWIDPVHECIPLQGNIFYSDIAVIHEKPKNSKPSVRNLEIYEVLLQNGEIFTPRQLYYYARELYDHKLYERAALRFMQFLQEGKGWQEDNIAACYCLSMCFKALGGRRQQLTALLRSFSFGTPRAEICSELGYYYKEQQDLTRAIDWFRFAATLEPPQLQGFLLQDYWGYIPHLELCVCYYAQGDIEKAIFHNEEAARIRPNAAPVLLNREFFASLSSKNE